MNSIKNNVIRAAVPVPAHRASAERKELNIGSDVEIANRVREDLQNQYGHIVHCDGSFWRYSGTAWEVVEDHEIRLAVHSYDGASFQTGSGALTRAKLSKARVDSVLHECAALCAEPKFFTNPPAGINCASGSIQFDDAGRPHLLKHHPDHRCRHTLPGHWSPGLPGTAPKGSLLQRFLNGSFMGEPEAQAICELLAEICGAAALGYATRLTQPRAIVLLGQTAENGKSQFLDLARGLLPASAVCSVPAAKMGDEKHLIGLSGKLLNASDEISPEAVASNTFKSVVTGEPVAGRDLYKSRVEFQSVALNLFSANQLPSFKGGIDRGLLRRLLVVPFTRTIPLEERIEGIGKRVACEEADLLLAWAVDGATRLIRQGTFSIPESCLRALNEWVLGEDPVLAWIEICVRVVPIVNGGPLIATRDAYRHFQAWARAEGFSERIPSINSFVQRVYSHVRGIQRKRLNTGPFFVGMVVTQG